MSKFKRADRVADVIRTEVAAILQRQIKDPRIGTVTVTGVKVSDDLRNARVFFVEMGKDTLDPETQAGLESAAGFLKRELGRRLQLRHVPDVVFTFDSSFAYGNRIEHLLAEIHREEEPHVPEDH
jgi:ribosome-binding factor A